MKKFLLSLTLAATAITAIPAAAQAQSWENRQERREDRRDDRRDQREDRRDDRQDRRADRRDDRRDNRQQARDWRTYRNYDWNRPEQRGGRYYAERYYRDGTNYRPVRVNRNTRIYRGGDGRYYCRRQDGTTGLIIGAAVGGLLGNRIDNGNSSLLGTLIGAGGGALLGREIDRGGVSCR